MSKDLKHAMLDSPDDEGQVSSPTVVHPAKVRTYAISTMHISRNGLPFITTVEGRGRDTDGLQWPGDKSGVTVRLGYDLSKRSPSLIISDLTSIGISRDKAEIIAVASGMHGSNAGAFVKNHKSFISLTDYQKQSLLQKIMGTYEQTFKSKANFDVTQYQFDALVSLTFNAGGPLNVITHSLATGNLAQAEKDWLSRTHSGNNLRQGLVNRRKYEVNLYKNGIYR